MKRHTRFFWFQISLRGSYEREQNAKRHRETPTKKNHSFLVNENLVRLKKSSLYFSKRQAQGNVTLCRH